MFGSKSRKAAKLEQERVLAENRRKAAEEEAYLKQQRQEIETEKAKFAPIQEEALQAYTKYRKGGDISGIYPELSATLGQAARTMQSSQRMPAAFGKTDAYNRKLMGARQAGVATGLGELLTTAAEQKAQSDLGLATNVTNLNTGQRQLGMGTFQQLMGTAGQQFNEATAKRQMEIQRGEMARKAFMDTIGGIANAAAGAMTGVGALQSASALGGINKSLANLKIPGATG